VHIISSLKITKELRNINDCIEKNGYDQIDIVKDDSFSDARRGHYKFLVFAFNKGLYDIFLDLFSDFSINSCMTPMLIVVYYKIIL
jgi:hypothetical protein